MTRIAVVLIALTLVALNDVRCFVFVDVEGLPRAWLDVREDAGRFDLYSQDGRRAAWGHPGSLPVIMRLLALGPERAVRCPFQPPPERWRRF